MWFITAIFFAYQYVIRVMPNVMFDDIIRQFNVDATSFGQFSGIYYIGYSLAHIPLGIMFDRYGVRKVMTGCTLLVVIGLLPLLFTDIWKYPVAGRLIIGIGSAAAVLGLFNVVRVVFNEKHFSRMVGAAVTIGLVAAMYGGGPLKSLCNVLGYKTVIQILVGLGLALAVAIYFLMPQLKSQSSGKDSVLSNIKLVLTNYRVIALCVCAGLMVGPLEGFADAWGGKFLKEVYGFDEQAATYLTSAILFGMCFGAPIVVGPFADKIGHLKSIIVEGLIMLAVFIALLAGVLTMKTILIGFVIVGICSGYQLPAIYKSSLYVPARVAGLTTAVANMIIMIFGYGFHSSIGVLVDKFGGASSPEAFVYGVSVIPVALGLGVIGLVVLACKDRAR
jgi:predicted MFS family arabinose efflux permease